MFITQLLHASLYKILDSLKMRLFFSVVRLSFVQQRKKKSKKRKKTSSKDKKNKIFTVKNTKDDENTVQHTEECENIVQHKKNCEKIIKDIDSMHLVNIDNYDIETNSNTAESGWTTVVSRRKSRYSSWC